MADLKECKIIPFKTKEQQHAEIAFRHLCDHLDDNPCYNCIDAGTDYCTKECKSIKIK